MSGEPTFYELADKLDARISLANPDIEQIESVMTLIADEALERYFFKHLAESGNLGWFEPLKARGIFEKPTEPIEVEGKVVFPQWYALWYLIAVAPYRPEDVVSIAETLQTRNLNFMLGLIRTAPRMPSAEAARMAHLVIRWADVGLPLEESVLELTQYLITQRQWDAAYELAELILSVAEQPVSEEMRQSPFFFPQAAARAEIYFARQFVESVLPNLSEYDPLRTLQVAQHNLEEALQIEGHNFSYISRPAIELHNQNIGQDIKNLLVDSLVQALQALFQQDQAQGRQIIQNYLQHRWSIFRRIAIHTIRLNAAIVPDLVRQLFSTKQYLEDQDVHHEYWLLMHEMFGTLSQPGQSNFVEFLLSQLPPEQKDYDYAQHGQRYHILRQLEAIKGYLTQDKHREIVAELREMYNKPEHPEFLSHSQQIIGFVGSTSSVDLAAMPSEDILAELKKELPHTDFDKPSQEGLAHSLKDAVIEDPQHFVDIIPGLIASSISPIYIEYLLWGLREAWTGGKDFDWEPVLALCSKVSKIGLTEDQESDSSDSDHRMRSNTEIRRTVADLIKAGVVNNKHAIPYELLSTARDILFVLADDPEPTTENERKWAAEVPYGFLTVALNVVRARAIETLLQYALHLARTQQETSSKEESLLGSRMEQAVRGKLTEKLDKRLDPSLAVHCLFGKYFPNLDYLDKAWVLTHLEEIFPRTPEMIDYWEVAWNGYLYREDFFDHLYEVLKPYYRYALNQMALGESGRAGADYARTRFAQHLALLYWRGLETFETEDSLIPVFFTVASDTIRAMFVRHLGGGLREVSPSNKSDEWQRAKMIWKERFDRIKVGAEQENALEGFTQELDAFSSWIPFIPENLAYFYEDITLAVLSSQNGSVHNLLDFFVSIANEHVFFVVSLLEALVQQDRGSWFWMTRDKVDQVRTILETALQSTDENAKVGAIRIINIFGAQYGDERYRDLLALAKSESKNM